MVRPILGYEGVRDTPVAGFGPSPAQWAVRSINGVQVSAGPAARSGIASQEWHLKAMQTVSPRVSPSCGWRAKDDLIISTKHVESVPSYHPFRPFVRFDDADSPAYSGFTPLRLHTYRHTTRPPPTPQGRIPTVSQPGGQGSKFGVMMSPMDSHGLMMPMLGSPRLFSGGGDNGGGGDGAAAAGSVCAPAEGGAGWSAATERGTPVESTESFRPPKVGGGVSFQEQDTPADMKAVHQLPMGDDAGRLRLPQDYL